MSDDDELPEWVLAAMEVVGMDTMLPSVVDEPECSSCGGDDQCKHGSYEMRANGSHTCTKCKRLLHGTALKDESRCAQCGRIWE